MKVKLVSDEVSYYKKAWDSVIEINGKQVRVGSYDEQDNVFSQYDADNEINQDDFKKLTEEEQEVLGEYLTDILGGEVGEEWDTDNEAGCMHNFEDDICKLCGYVRVGEEHLPDKDKRYCHLCGSEEVDGGWCTNKTCSEYTRYEKGGSVK